MKGLRLMVLCLVVAGCRTGREAERERVVVRRDTVERVSLRADTVKWRDSVYVADFRRGDTVYRTEYRERWRWRDRWRTDTVVRVSRDTVRVKERVAVKEKRSWRERAKEWLGGFGVGVVVGVIVVIILKRS